MKSDAEDMGKICFYIAVVAGGFAAVLLSGQEWVDAVASVTVKVINR